jgi:hypothetical protein
MEREEKYDVRQSVPEFGLPPYLYIEINGKRSGLSPHLHVGVGDLIILQRASQPVAENYVDQKGADTYAGQDNA